MPDLRVQETDGNVGIGTGYSTVNYKLHVNGSAAKPGGGDWDMPSDRNLKSDIKNFKQGLKEILELRPVTYKYNGKGGISDTEKTHVGLIAQDYQKIRPEDISVQVHEEYEGSYSELEGTTTRMLSQESYLHVNASPIRYMLVNAIKEQQEMILDQEDQISDLIERLSQLEAIVGAAMEESSTSIVLENSKASLSQNSPNPFENQTTIQYSLPDNTDNASIRITDSTGRIIQTVNLGREIKGQVNVESNNFNNGIYFYSLLIGGEVKETKQMLLNK